ncbi:MAG: hypothetical protein ABGU93_06895 [Acetobacterium sp.]|uniref:hypothetical protein n=1 Tax=Acetobacterium sp. TaxID=1872094 RepID=UPI003241FCFC
MKKYSSSIFILIIIFLVLFALTLPLLLAHELNAETSLTFPNLLSYYGSILGAGATIVAVVLTINYNKKQIGDERRLNEIQLRNERTLSVKPYLEAQFLQIFPADHLSNICSNDYDYKYFLVEFDTNEITPSTHFPENLKRYKGGINEITAKQKYITIKYSLSNVGAGNALDIAMKLNNKSVCPNFALPINTEKVFIFLFVFSENAKIENKAITLVYEFHDIYTLECYLQTDEFDIGPANSYMCLWDSNSRITPPKKIKTNPKIETTKNNIIQ